MLLFSCLALTQLKAQDNGITLDYCYALAKQNYPAIQKIDLVAKSADYTIKNSNKAFLPQFTVSGQATYQSDVANYSDLFGANGSPLGITPPEFSKQQYKVQAEVEQLLFDGGNVRYQNKITRANTDLQQKNIEVELYAINERINAIFFSILLLDQQVELIKLKLMNLESQLGKTTAAYQYGTSYLSDVNEIKAEIETTKSQQLDYQGNSMAYLRMLSIFIGKEIHSSSQLISPEPTMYNRAINRPELTFYEGKKTLYEAEDKQLRSTYLPKLSAFIQGAYGRPTLNPLSNDFGSWYVTGIRLSWSLGNLYTLKNKRHITQINSSLAEVDKHTFIQNVEMEMAQEDQNVSKYTAMIIQDQKAIELRESVTQSALAQLNNGVITTHEYIQKLNSENIARQNLILHQIQLLQAQYNLKFKSGN